VTSVSTFVNPPRITLRLAQPGRFSSEVSFAPTQPFALNPLAGFARNEIAESLILRVGDWQVELVDYPVLSCPEGHERREVYPDFNTAWSSVFGRDSSLWLKPRGILKRQLLCGLCHGAAADIFEALADALKSGGIRRHG
jgi:hypothetical protein